MDFQRVQRHFAPALGLVSGIATAYLFFAGGHPFIALTAVIMGVSTALAMRD